MKKIVVFCITLILLSSCTRSFDGGYNMPLLYKIDIQQGNVIEQDMLNKLRPGMNKDQVKFIMGTPVIVDPFHNDRWEYIFSFQEGGGVREQRHITLHFEDEKLSHLSGDVEISYVPRDENEIVTEDEAIVVPEGSYKEEERGLFGRIWDKITPGDD
jgi:outer membrane protein assembly factor BamE